MSVPLKERWWSTEWHLDLGRYRLTVSSGWADVDRGNDFAWEVWSADGRTLKAQGRKPDEKAAKLAARRWVETRS